MAPVTKPSAVLGLVAYRGDAKTLLAWDLAADHRERLAGFTIAAKPPGGEEYYLYNQLQFDDPAQRVPNASGYPNSSANAPFQKFRWLHVPGSDHQGLKPERGVYTYTVTPRYFDDEEKLAALDPALSTSVEVLMDRFSTGSLALGFTRGYVQSQAYARHFGPTAKIAKRGAPLLADTSEVAGQTPAGADFTYAEEYEWLGYTARETIFALLDEVLADASLKLDLFAYDLDEPDVLKKLLALAEQGRVRVILDNSAEHHSTTKKEPEDEFQAEFEKVATGEAGIERGKFSRFAHCKIMVVSGAGGPTKVLTGSTNFSVSGLYVNANHVLVFSDAATAAKYGELFQQVWEEGVSESKFVASALSAEAFAPAGELPPRTINFAPHTEERATAILTGISDRVDAEGPAAGASPSVLFAVMALQGSGTVYPALEELHKDESVFTYGVSDAPDGIALYAPGHKTGVLVSGKPNDTRLPPPFSQVPSIGLSHQIHHKFVICGFNGADPVLYCGSSNLALGGERENGDNLIEIHDGDVAAAFAIEAMALVDHFDFLDRLSSKGADTAEPPASKREAAVEAGWFLATTDAWSAPYFDADDLHFVDRELFAAPLS